jgi:uncharacterized C2H2 Zn-finger protein
MKIISHGVLPEETLYRHSCNYCGAVFEYLKKEAKYIFDQRDGDSLKISCPTCERACYNDVKSKVWNK